MLGAALHRKDKGWVVFSFGGGMLKKKKEGAQTLHWESHTDELVNI